MLKKPLFALNIRQKVILSFIFYALAIFSIGYYSYTNLRLIEQKLSFLEKLNELSNIVLEIRRYEKNYLLYKSTEALQEMANHIKRADEILAGIDYYAKSLKGAEFIKTLKLDLQLYKKAADRLQSVEALTEDEMDQLRNQGKKLISSIESAVSVERSRIFEIIKFLKAQLSTVLIIAILVGILTANMIVRKIIRPLKEIEKATLLIAEGNFEQIPLPDTYDETRNVIEAFNRMIQELDIRQDQLFQTKKLSSLGILASGVAHQLNNPLNNISTTAQILLMDLEQMDQETIKNMVSNIERETRRARDIVKGLLEFSRTRHFTIVPTHLKSILDKAIQLVASQIPPQVELVIDVPVDLIIPMDPQRMQEVFINMITNALQAIESKSGRIEITARSDKESGKAIIKIKDTGKGIPKENLSKIFDPFFTTKEGPSGTGLGLSIVYGIIKKHKGSIEVTSEVGKGTEFEIRLPLNAEDRETEHQRAS